MSCRVASRCIACCSCVVEIQHTTPCGLKQNRMALLLCLANASSFSLSVLKRWCGMRWRGEHVCTSTLRRAGAHAFGRNACPRFTCVRATLSVWGVCECVCACVRALVSGNLCVCVHACVCVARVRASVHSGVLARCACSRCPFLSAKFKGVRAAEGGASSCACSGVCWHVHQCMGGRVRMCAC